MKQFLSAAALAFGSMTAIAAPIVGNNYLDASNVAWEYIGSFNVTDGAPWSQGGPTFNGIEAATAVFGALGAGEAYALSTSDTMVDHLAWYDGYGQIQHLKGYGVGLAEDLNEDPGNDGYNFAGQGQGDFSAYVRDHISNAGASVNYVFTRELNTVPEPASLALVLLGIGAAWGARKRNQG